MLLTEIPDALFLDGVMPFMARRDVPRMLWVSNAWHPAINAHEQVWITMVCESLIWTIFCEMKVYP